LTNTEILKANPKLLAVVDQQKRYALQQAQAKMPCPNCHLRVNQFDAAGIDDIDRFTFGAEQRKYHCPKCGRELLFVVPAVSTVPWVWKLVPENPDLDTKGAA
jgi:ribosomal protein L37AE/L43A